MHKSDIGMSRTLRSRRGPFNAQSAACGGTLQFAVLYRTLPPASHAGHPFAGVMGFTGARPLMLVEGGRREQVY